MERKGKLILKMQMLDFYQCLTSHFNIVRDHTRILTYKDTTMLSREETWLSRKTSDWYRQLENHRITDIPWGEWNTWFIMKCSPDGRLWAAHERHTGSAKKGEMVLKYLEEYCYTHYTRAWYISNKAKSFLLDLS